MINNITESVKYIGVDDTDIDLFEGQYLVPQGISYNSYIILDDKIAVMDTIDQRKTEEWIENMEEVLQGQTPDYLIVQHMEPDHAANIGLFASKYPNAIIVASAKAIQMLPQFFEHVEFEGRTLTVKEGDTLNLGAHTLQFFMAPMVHWPEVMVTYEQSEKILFSADAFGKFGAICNGGEWLDEARRYFINICGKYGTQVQALLKKAATLDISTICPLHGPVISGNIENYIKYYDIWSKYEAEEEGILIAYASIHGNTAKTAETLAQILSAKGVENVILTDLTRNDMSEAVENAFKYSKMVVAAPSYDAGLFPPMYDFLHHLKIKNYQKRKVAVIENGSWAPTAGKIMNAMLSEMKDIDIIEKMITIKSCLKQYNIKELEDMADSLI